MTTRTLWLLALLIMTFSCVSYEEMVNFNDGPEFPDNPEPMALQIPELRVQPDDIISIRVQTMDMEVAQQFNMGGGRQQNLNFNNPAAINLAGYLVDKSGYIDFPVLGQILVQGLTALEVREKIVRLLEDGNYLVDPTVIVRFLNFRITVLGEVSNPGTYVMSDERVTILDALGQAGDITNYGRRTNVLLIREYDNEREYQRLNLQDRAVFQSPFFYLRQNDVIYVEPLPEIAATVRDQSQRVLPWLSVVSSLLALALTIANLTN